MEKLFIDTNIIVYANDTRDKKKQQQAIHVIKSLIVAGKGVISTQVLQEYCYVALYKLGQRADVVLRQVKLLEGFEIVNQSPEQIRRAVEIAHTYNINFWDGCIISNAEYSNCTAIYSEDLNPGQFYAGIEVRNPFESATVID
jgi:predicted nucleic acid-binding protein